MRVNVYNEELSDRVVLKEESAEGIRYFGLRFFLELPATVDGKQYRGPFQHSPGDDDSAAVTFWSTDKSRLIKLMQSGLSALEEKSAPQD